jgi:hypothetical protein
LGAASLQQPSSLARTDANPGGAGKGRIVGWLPGCCTGCVLPWLGWILCTVGLSQGLVTFANECAVYALLTTSGSGPGGLFLAWLTT